MTLVFHVLKKFRLFGISGFTFLLLCGCSVTPNVPAPPASSLSVYIDASGSNIFHAARAEFSVRSSYQQVFRILGDTKRIQDWMLYVRKVELLEYYDHNHFLIRAQLDLPWPFKDRELIACVDTGFDRTGAVIRMYDCANRVDTTSVIRIAGLASEWRLVSADDGGTRIYYDTWIDLGGRIPAYAFNLLLKPTTEHSMRKLIALINAAPTDGVGRY